MGSLGPDSVPLNPLQNILYAHFNAKPMYLPFFYCALLGLTLTTARPIETSFATGNPIVTWLTPRKHDFGTIQHDRPVVFVFKFQNISTETILLETVRTTCGCTAASWTEKPLAPGETGEVRIEYDAYKTGDFRKKITVFFDKQRKAEVLNITGTVEGS
jgi:hypothetical protein